MPHENGMEMSVESQGRWKGHRSICPHNDVQNTGVSHTRYLLDCGTSTFDTSLMFLTTRYRQVVNVILKCGFAILLYNVVDSDTSFVLGLCFFFILEMLYDTIPRWCGSFALSQPMPFVVRIHMTDKLPLAVEIALCSLALSLMRFGHGKLENNQQGRSPPQTILGAVCY